MRSRSREVVKFLTTADRKATAVDLAIITALTVLTRSYIYRAVFRKGDTVLLANDPYLYRYFVDTIVGAAEGAADPALFLSPTVRPAPLLISSLAWLSEVAGGNPTLVGPIVAWYPVVAAVVTGWLVYSTAKTLSGTRWGGLAAGVTLAIIPIYALRTALGFADHHAFDYVWLAATLWALVRYAEVADPQSRRAWVTAVILGFTIAGQALAWLGGSLLLVPVGLYVQYCVYESLRNGRPPARARAPLLSAIAIGAVLVLGIHTALGWLPVYVAALPTLLFAGAIGVVGAGELARRSGHPKTVFLGIEGGGLVLFILIARGLGVFRALAGDADNYFTQIGTVGIVETVSLIGGGPWAPVLGPFSLFGLILFAAVPVLGVATWAAVRRPRPAVTVVAIYAWYFIALAVIQRRFAGELSVVVAVLLGCGVVGLAVRLQVISPRPTFSTAETPLRLNIDVPLSRVVVFALVLMLISSASFALIPVKMTQATYDGDKHDAARWMSAYADEQGWTFPDNYVLSSWSETRMYNYFVTNWTLGYTYARRHYQAVLSSVTPRETYIRHRARVGFIVTTDDHPPSVRVVNGSQELSLYARLHDHQTSRRNGVPGLAHYRMLWMSPDESVTVSTFVRGATMEGTASPNSTVRVQTDVQLTHGTVSYVRLAETDANGAFTVTVPYAGLYSVGNTSHRITESEVQSGTVVTVNETESTTCAQVRPGNDRTMDEKSVIDRRNDLVEQHAKLS